MSFLDLLLLHNYSLHQELTAKAYWLVSSWPIRAVIQAVTQGSSCDTLTRVGAFYHIIRTSCSLYNYKQIYSILTKQIHRRCYILHVKLQVLNFSLKSKLGASTVTKYFYLGVQRSGCKFWLPFYNQTKDEQNLQAIFKPQFCTTTQSLHFRIIPNIFATDSWTLGQNWKGNRYQSIFSSKYGAFVLSGAWNGYRFHPHVLVTTFPLRIFLPGSNQCRAVQIGWCRDNADSLLSFLCNAEKCSIWGFLRCTDD